MCGICGACRLDGPLDLPPAAPGRMLGALRHRGPEEFGAWRDERVFLGHARLKIIDLAGGGQPLCNEDGAVWITFNGEIFNYPELREELEGLGHVFRTRSDTETIVHAWEQWGEDCVARFNGQFAFALYDRRRGALLLARDRYGIRPLFWTVHDGVLLFASEVKGLAGWPGCAPALDPGALGEVLTYWVNIPPRTPFAGVRQLPPGHTALVARGPDGVGAADGDGPVRPRRYWRPDFPDAAEDHRHVRAEERRVMARKVREALREATMLRLRADVPVGAYLSGGLDSSATAALVRETRPNPLKTFSVGFADAAYDETRWQELMAARLGTDHAAIRVDGADIAARFADVVWHAETPLLRTAPTPLFALSALVRDESFKVVLTGEGADEVFCGYNIFREAKVRAFWARDPGSRRRPRLLTRLYPYLDQSPPEFLARFYGVGLDRPDDPFFSHEPRWRNTGRTRAFLAPDAAAAAEAALPEAAARLAASLPGDFDRWGPVARAQYLEMTTFLPGYLLSSQGDRMLMGNTVEGRFPFLDHELTALAASIPASAKLASLQEKSILKQAVDDLLPEEIVSRPKQPYRAPDAASFRSPPGEALVDEMLDEAALARAGLFAPAKVAGLRRKWSAGRLASVSENMAFVAVLSAQVLARRFGPELAARIDAGALSPDAVNWREAP